MAKAPSSKPSFSARQRWGIFFSVALSIVAVLALVLMLNYLGARYYERLSWSAQTRAQLSPQTVSVLKGVTNEINVTVFYDKKDPLYGYIKDLLDEYRLTNPKISVHTVDYLIDAGEAVKVQEKYKEYMGPGTDTNVIILNCNGATRIIPGELLGRYVWETELNGKQAEFQNKLVSFQGELAFTGAILNLVSSKPMKAYFLEGLNGKHLLEDQDILGYKKFKIQLQCNNIQTTSITNLLGTNAVPDDCNLLIIAGPVIVTPTEQAKIRQYLDSGGRLFVLFNYLSRELKTGLEPILADWDVNVGWNVIQDVKHSADSSGNDIMITDFNKTHQLVNPLLGDSRFFLELILPRSVGTNANKLGPDAPKAQELAWTAKSAVVNDKTFPAGQPVPVIVAVEKASVKGLAERGTTRIVVAGDSFFLDNQLIGSGRNRAFAGYAVNWLLDQTQLLQGVGPKPITTYKLMMTRAQLGEIRWIFLAAMPGGVLLLGGLVWLRRRH